MSNIQFDEEFDFISVGSGGGSMVSALVMRAMGIDVKALKTVVFQANGDTQTALMGGHVDLAPLSLAAAQAALQQGKVRILGITTAQRGDGPLASIPTWKEQGIDSVYTSWRVIVAPRGVSDEEVRAVAGAFAKMAAMPQWKAELEKNYWIGNYLGPEATKAFLGEQLTEHRNLLTQLGLAK